MKIPNEVHNFNVEDNGTLPPYIPGGEKWRADVRFIQDGVELGGYNLYAIIRSEKKLLGMR